SSASKSLSPVMIASALAATAHSNTFKSSGSRKAGGFGSGWVIAISATATSVATKCAGVSPRRAMRLASLRRCTTSSNSLYRASEMASSTRPSLTASINLDGTRSQSNPETIRLVSTTAFTVGAAFCSGCVNLRLDFFLRHFVARHRMELFEHRAKLLTGTAAFQFPLEQARHHLA